MTHLWMTCPSTAIFHSKLPVHWRISSISGFNQLHRACFGRANAEALASGRVQAVLWERHLAAWKQGLTHLWDQHGSRIKPGYMIWPAARKTSGKTSGKTPGMHIWTRSQPPTPPVSPCPMSRDLVANPELIHLDCRVNPVSLNSPP